MSSDASKAARSHPHPALPMLTERLVIRPGRIADADAIQAAIDESFADLHLWMPWAREHQSLEETRSFLAEAEANLRSGDDFALAGWHAETGALVLAVGLHPRSWRVPKFEIGYWCRASMQGNGYTTEAVRAVTKVAFTEMGAHRVEIRCDARNARSRRVAELAGFTLEAKLRFDDVANDGSLRDTLVYVQLRGGE